MQLLAIGAVSINQRQELGSQTKFNNICACYNILSPSRNLSICSTKQILIATVYVCKQELTKLKHVIMRL